MVHDYKFVDVPEIFDIYKEVVAHARELGYLEGAETPPLYWIQNKTHPYGCCNWTIQRTEERNYYNSTGVKAIVRGIFINEMFRNASEKIIRTILVHEVAHMCSVTKYGPKWGKGHCDYFYAIGDKLGYKWGIKVTRGADDETCKEFEQEYAKQKGFKVYDKLYQISLGSVYLRTRTVFNKAIADKYVDTDVSYRRQYFYTTKDARDKKAKEFTDRGFW